MLGEFVTGWIVCGEDSGNLTESVLLWSVLQSILDKCGITHLN